MLDREIRQLDLASNKVKAEVKKLALKGGKDDLTNCRILVREVVRSNKQRERLYTSQARLNSINMQLSHQLGQSLFSSLPSFRRSAYRAQRGSYGKDHRNTAEVNRDNEAIKFTDQAT